VTAGGGDHTNRLVPFDGGGPVSGGGRSSSSLRPGSFSQGATKQNAGAGSTVTADQASIGEPAAITPPTFVRDYERFGPLSPPL
jgi:hypothetical protein